MTREQRRSLGLGLRIAGNLIAAGSLISYALTLESDPAHMLVPREYLLIGAVLGFTLVVAAIFVGYLPESGRQAEARIRREFEAQQEEDDDV